MSCSCTPPSNLTAPCLMSKYPTQAIILFNALNVTMSDDSAGTYSIVAANASSSTIQTNLSAAITWISCYRLNQYAPIISTIEAAARAPGCSESQINLMVNLVSAFSEELLSLVNYGDLIENVALIVTANSTNPPGPTNWPDSAGPCLGYQNYVTYVYGLFSIQVAAITGLLASIPTSAASCSTYHGNCAANVPVKKVCCRNNRN